MSDAEAVMWSIEQDPALRSDFCNLTILERQPAMDRIREVAARAVEVIPHLGQRVVEPPVPLAPPEWVTVEHLDLDHHVHRVEVPAPGGMREVLDVAAAIADQALDRTRPLWEFTLLEGLAGGRAALLHKVHHTITDGEGGLRLSASLVELRPDPKRRRATARPGAPEVPAAAPEPPPSRGLAALWNVVGAGAARSAALAGRAVGGAARTAIHPGRLPAQAADALRTASSIRRQLLVVDGAHSDVLLGRSPERHFETLAVSLPAAREAAHTLGGSVNDLFVTAVAGALGRYHDADGSTVETLRMAMPVSTRAKGETASNRFSPTRVLVPIDPDDPAARFAVVHELLGQTRQERAVGLYEGLTGLMSGLPPAVLIAAAHSQTRTIDFTTSNLRGSPVPLWLAGARLEANYPFGPRAGCALNVTTLSYCDELHLGLNLDPAAVTEPQRLLADLDASFAELLELG